MNIVYLPLDERPCNLLYPKMLAEMTDLPFISPEKSILGRKKEPADFTEIKNWLLKAAKHADHLIVSVDMLVYGGILPSRLHSLTLRQCEERLNVLKEVKAQNPQIRIHAFNLIMRVPAYNSGEEEPDYYAEHGRNLFLYGRLTDKAERGSLEEEERQELSKVKEELPDHVLDDFTLRRETNAGVNRLTVDLVDSHVIDDLIIPLDDNSEYGFSAREQRQLLFKVEELNLLDRISIYPGADEIGCTLLARVFCEVKQYRPQVNVRYSSTHGPYIIPALEDRCLNESIKSHLTAAHAVITGNEGDADFVLMVNAPAAGQANIAGPVPFRERHPSYFSEINLREFAEAIRHFASAGKMVAVADVATLNGSDHTLMKILSKTGLLDKIEAYAGWNTSGNTLGTVIAHAVIRSYYEKSGSGPDLKRKSRAFYRYRLVEDWGYQSFVRQDVTHSDLPHMGADYFHLSSVQDNVEKVIHQKLNRFIEQYLSDLHEGEIRIEKVYLPWKRMFEVGLELS